MQKTDTCPVLIHVLFHFDTQECAKSMVGKMAETPGMIDNGRYNVFEKYMPSEWKGCSFLPPHKMTISNCLTG